MECAKIYITQSSSKRAKGSPPSPCRGVHLCPACRLSMALYVSGPGFLSLLVSAFSSCHWSLLESAHLAKTRTLSALYLGSSPTFSACNAQNELLLALFFHPQICPDCEPWRRSRTTFEGILRFWVIKCLTVSSELPLSSRMPENIRLFLFLISLRCIFNKVLSFACGPTSWFLALLPLQPPGRHFPLTGLQSALG